MMQVQQKFKAPKKANQKMKEKYETIKKKPTTRIVTLVYEHCCCAGCNDVKIQREVPYDSYFRDGDRIQRREVRSTDKVVE